MTNIDQTKRTANKNASRSLNGYHVLAMFVAFFGVIITVNFTMAWLASNSWTGLVVKNSYVASQEYNEKLDAARVQKERGWQMNFAYRAARVTVTMHDQNNEAVVLPNLELTIGRPSSQSIDQTVLLNHSGGGKYVNSIDLSPGIWGFELNSAGEKPYHIEGRLVVSDKDIGIMQ